MYLPTNIIKLSKQNCNCKSGVNPEWNVASVFNIAITDNINFEALVDTTDCNSIWSLLNQIRLDSILEFELRFKLRFKDFARRVLQPVEKTKIGAFDTAFGNFEGFSGCVIKPKRIKNSKIVIDSVRLQANKVCKLKLFVYKTDNENLDNVELMTEREIVFDSLNNPKTTVFKESIVLPCFESENEFLRYLVVVQKLAGVKLLKTIDNTSDCQHHLRRCNDYRDYMMFEKFESDVIDESEFDDDFGSDFNALNPSLFKKRPSGTLFSGEFSSDDFKTEYIAQIPKSGVSEMCITFSIESNPIELIEKVATNPFYELAARCVQEIALSKLHEKIINSSEISRALMMESEKSIIAAKVHMARFEKQLNELCEKLPKKGIWRDLYFGSYKENYQ